MDYRAVGDRCAVILDTLPLQREDTLALLIQKGFRVLDVDLIAFARRCMSTSQYRRGARPSEAPGVVDCSSLMKWLYGQRGIWLPRRSIQQRALGDEVAITDICSGDLIFTAGWIDYYLDDPADGVGHVGIATGEGTVIHAADARAGVVETPFERFLANNSFRGARRYIPRDREILTLGIPPHRCVETTDDLRWIILQSLPE